MVPCLTTRLLSVRSRSNWTKFTNKKRHRMKTTRLKSLSSSSKHLIVNVTSTQFSKRSYKRLKIRSPKKTTVPMKSLSQARPLLNLLFITMVTSRPKTISLLQRFRRMKHLMTVKKSVCCNNTKEECMVSKMCLRLKSASKSKNLIVLLKRDLTEDTECVRSNTVKTFAEKRLKSKRLQLSSSKRNRPNQRKILLRNMTIKSRKFLKTLT